MLIPISLKLSRKYAYVEVDHVCFLITFDVKQVISLLVMSFIMF